MPGSPGVARPDDHDRAASVLGDVEAGGAEDCPHRCPPAPAAHDDDVLRACVAHERPADVAAEDRRIDRHAQVTRHLVQESRPCASRRVGRLLNVDACEDVLAPDVFLHENGGQDRTLACRLVSTLGQRRTR